MEREGLTQSALAKAAKVSQSTVSRALEQLPVKHSRARQKLFVYAGLLGEVDEGSTVEGTKLVSRAFEQLWDGTDRQARAVAKIIQTLREI
jgi:arginine repressor